MYDAVCAECGKTTKVPFQPTGSRPVYCSDCYHTKGAAGGPRPSDSARSGGGSFQRPSGGSGAPKPAGSRSFGGGRSESRPAGPRESSFDSFDFSDYGDFGGDPYGAPNPGRGSRKRNNKRENKERSRKEGGGGRPKGRYNFDDDDDEMYY